MSDQSSLAGKSKANLEAAYRDMYRQVKSPPSSSANKPLAHRRESTETHTDKSTMKSHIKSPKMLTKMPMMPPVESATMTSPRWSPKHNSNNDFHLKHHRRVNVKY